MKLNDWKRQAEEYRDVDRAIVEKLVPWRVTMDKRKSTWNYFTHNPHGGGFGSNYCGPFKIAHARAIHSMKSGTQYNLIVNGQDQGIKWVP